MVWVGISHGVKTPLVVIQGNFTAVHYRDQVLMPHVSPLVNTHNLTFQHDNARPHVARVCRDFLNQYNVQVLDWPPYIPDLNPIEHLWDALDRRIRKRVNEPNNVAQLQVALIQEWNHIPQRTIDKLVGSIVRRVRAATAARGGHTRYWYPLFNNVGCLCLTLFIANVVCYTTLNQYEIKKIKKLNNQMKSTIFFKNTTPELILAFLFSASILSVSLILSFRN